MARSVDVRRGETVMVACPGTLVAGPRACGGFAATGAIGAWAAGAGVAGGSRTGAGTGTEEEWNASSVRAVVVASGRSAGSLDSSERIKSASGPALAGLSGDLVNTA